MLTKLESRRADTPATPCNSGEVSAKPLQRKACTPDTRDTPVIEDTGEEAHEAGADPGPCWRWRLIYPGGEIDELDCWPWATVAEVRERYPGTEVERIETAELDGIERS